VSGKAPIGVSITGNGEAHLAEDGLWRVPKAEIVRSLLIALKSQRIRIAQGLAHGATLMKELNGFKAKIRRNGHVAFEGVGTHDGL
jgi:hypothetical protein